MLSHLHRGYHRPAIGIHRWRRVSRSRPIDPETRYIWSRAPPRRSAVNLQTTIRPGRETPVFLKSEQRCLRA